MNLPLFLLGFCHVQTDQTHAAALLDFCLQERLTLANFENTENGDICFRVGALSAARLLRRCKQANIPVHVSRGGLPKFLFFAFRRAGLVCGLLFGFFLLAISSRFVWSVRISGNNAIPSGQIRQALAEQGLEVGSYRPHLNLSEIETKMLIAEENISWISIHMSGTVAEVQIVESVFAPPKNNQPANLIAAADGQIEELELYRGKSMVEVGQPVRKGDLLVSGIYDSQTVGYRYTRAAGRVLARTERVIRVEVPLLFTQKTYQKAVCGSMTLQFFQFSFNFFKNSRNGTISCDIIELTTGKDWLGLHDLPVSILQTNYLPYTETQATRSAREALDLAYEELEKQLGELSQNLQLLEKRIQTQIGEDSLVLECWLTCVENIAVQQDFVVSES